MEGPRTKKSRHTNCDIGTDVEVRSNCDESSMLGGSSHLVSG